MKFDAVMNAMSILTAILLGFSVYMAINVYKLVKLRDLPMLLSIISITLSLTCKGFKSISGI